MNLVQWPRWGALVRTVHSVLNETPPPLLKDIILVDDGSNPETHPWLEQQLAEYVDLLPKVRCGARARFSGPTIQWCAI